MLLSACLPCLRQAGGRRAVGRESRVVDARFPRVRGDGHDKSRMVGVCYCDASNSSPTEIKDNEISQH